MTSSVSSSDSNMAMHMMLKSGITIERRVDMGNSKLQRPPTHPGEILKEDFMAPLDISQTELAKGLKTTFRTVHEIVNGKRSISPEMALKLARYFGTSAEVWLNLQADYDLYKAGVKSRKVIDEIKPHDRKKAA